MAKAKKTEYKSQAITNSIKATSRISLKVNETFYTLEYTEERLIPAIDGIDIVKERELLWNTVNAEVDKQAEDVQSMYNKK